MPSHLRMAGQHGEIRYGYHRAADVRAWTIEWGWLRAELRPVNAFHLTQAPLCFRVDNSAAGRPPFERRLLDVTVAGDVLTARIGPRT